MSEPRYIHIHNWDRFQHPDATRNRRAAMPWVKDYVAQLDDDDYLSLTFSQRGVLQGLRLMYAARRGRGISEAQAKRVLCTSAAEARWWLQHLASLNHAGFIDFSASKDASNLASDLQAPDVDVDREEETILPSVARPDPPFHGEEPPENGWTGLESGNGQERRLPDLATVLKEMPK